MLLDSSIEEVVKNWSGKRERKSIKVKNSESTLTDIAFNGYRKRKQGQII